MLKNWCRILVCTIPLYQKQMALLGMTLPSSWLRNTCQNSMYQMQYKHFSYINYEALKIPMSWVLSISWHRWENEVWSVRLLALNDKHLGIQQGVFSDFADHIFNNTLGACSDYFKNVKSLYDHTWVNKKLNI